MHKCIILLSMTPIEVLKEAAAEAGGQKLLADELRDWGIKKVSQATISRKMKGGQSIPVDWFLAIQELYGIFLEGINSPCRKKRGSRDTQ